MTLATERAEKLGGETLRDAAREVLARCDILSRLTEMPGKMQRSFLSQTMRAVHSQVREWMRDAGMTIRMDAAGNLIAHRPGKSFLSKTLVIGSHLDTVPFSGKFDGLLGVIAPLAAIKLLGDIPLHVNIDVVGFSGTDATRFGCPHLGSTAMSGTLDPHALQWTDPQGTTLEAALHNFALHPQDLPLASLKPDQLAGFLELHVEQGPVLAELNAGVGVVMAAMGQTRLHLRLVGKPGHAGATPMRARKDALAGAADAVLVVETCAQEIDGLVATVSRLEVEPNGENAVPQEVRFTIDVRHEDNTSRENSVECMLTTIQQIARDRGLGMEMLAHSDTPSVQMNVEMTAKLIDAVRRVSPGAPVRKIISGEKHDAAVMAAITPSAMLMVRTPDGSSDSLAEDDVEQAIRVLHELLCTYAAG